MLEGGAFVYSSSGDMKMQSQSIAKESVAGHVLSSQHDIVTCDGSNNLHQRKRPPTRLDAKKTMAEISIPVSI